MILMSSQLGIPYNAINLLENLNFVKLSASPKSLTTNAILKIYGNKLVFFQLLAVLSCSE